MKFIETKKGEGENSGIIWIYIMNNNECIL